MDLMRLSGATIVGLEVCYELLHFKFLPLGGTHLSQIMILLGIGFVAQEVRAIWVARNGI